MFIAKDNKGNSLFIKEDFDNNKNENNDDPFTDDRERTNYIPASKSTQQLNANTLPRVKFLSDYDMNRSQKQPLLTDKERDRAVIEMNNDNDRWLDEKGLVIKDRSNLQDSKTDVADTCK